MRNLHRLALCLTLAASARADVVYPGLAQAILNSLYVNVAGDTLTGQLAGKVGTAGSPSFTFTGSPTTGMFLSAANAIGFATNGTERWTFNSSGSLVPVADNAYDIGNGTIDPRDVNAARNVVVGGAGLFANGSAAAPSLAFFSDADGSGTGAFRSGANAIGLSTNGVERWTLSSAGNLNPFAGNTYSIGNGSLPVKDITLSAGGGSETYIPCGRIESNTTPGATAADTTETDFWNYTLPANTIPSTGSSMRIIVWGNFASTATTKTVRVRVGGNVASVLTATFNNMIWRVEITLIRTGSTASQVLGVAVAATNNVSTANHNVDWMTLDMTATIAIRVTGQNGTANANDVTFRAGYIELCP